MYWFASSVVTHTVCWQQQFETQQQAEHFANEWVKKKLYPKQRKRKGKPNPNPSPNPVPCTLYLVLVCTGESLTHASTHESQVKVPKRKRVFTGDKHAKRSSGQALALTDKENCLKKFLGPKTTLKQLLELCGHMQTGRNTSQQTLGGNVVSARSAIHPTAELYRRLGLQPNSELRSTFPGTTVYDLSDRQRRRLIRVSTPLVKVLCNNHSP